MGAARTVARSRNPVAPRPRVVQSNSDVCTKYREAAKIANLALTGLVQQCEPGALVNELCKFGDQVITQVSGVLSFPTAPSPRVFAVGGACARGARRRRRAGASAGVGRDGVAARVVRLSATPALTPAWAPAGERDGGVAASGSRPRGSQRASVLRRCACAVRSRRRGCRRGTLCLTAPFAGQRSPPAEFRRRRPC